MSVNKGRPMAPARVKLAPLPWDPPAPAAPAAAPVIRPPENTLLRERIRAALRDGPLSTDEVRAIVDPAGSRSRAAVYNAISYLVRLSQVRKIPAEGLRRDRWALTGGEQ